MSSAQVHATPARQQSNESTASQRDEEKERLLNEKMEEIRKKNEQLKKRYEEIEADKRNANLNSKKAGTKHEDDYDESESDDGQEFPRGPGGKVSRQVDSKGSQQAQKAGKSGGRAPANSAVPYQQQSRQHSNLPAHNAPPPDPKFKFLDDPTRQGDEGYMGRGGRGRGTEFRRGGGRGSFGAGRGDEYGGHEYGGHMVYTNKSRGRPVGGPQQQEDPQLSENMDPEYVKWKAERSRIDAERLARQQTSSGHWKREWDVDKQYMRDSDSHGGRGDGRGAPRAYGTDHPQQRKDFRRPQHDNAHGKWQHSHEGDQQYHRRSYEEEPISRRIQGDSQSLKVTTHFGQDQRSPGKPRPQYDAASAARGGRSDRGQDWQQMRRRSDEGGQQPTPKTTPPRPLAKNEAAKGRPHVLRQEASMDTPSSEYASPEPQLEAHDQAQHESNEEEDQWEDVEENGANEEQYYYDEPHYEEAVGETGEDERALAAKLQEMEGEIRKKQNSDDVQGQVSSEHEEKITVAAMDEKKELGAIRRRQTTDGIGEGPEMVGNEDESPRARHESMDQIEREMIARLNENIQAAEAVLGKSEEDLDLLLSGSGAMVGAPMLEGADEEDLFQDDDTIHDNQLANLKSTADQQKSTNEASAVDAESKVDSSVDAKPSEKKELPQESEVD